MKKRIIAALAASAALISVTSFGSSPASAADLLVTTTTNVYEHSSASTSTASREELIPGGTAVEIVCYTTGPSVGGDTVWYFESPKPNDTGFIAGYYLNTGHDPHPGVPHC